MTKGKIPAADPADPAGAPAAGETPEAFPRDDRTVVVRGPAKGRWRIGRHFTPEPVTIPAAELSPEQVTALLDDPELTVLLIATPD